MGNLLGPKYILYSYMDPLGLVLLVGGGRGLLKRACSSASKKILTPLTTKRARNDSALSTPRFVWV